MAGRAAAAIRACGASSIRAATASCCSTSAAAARARRTPASSRTPPGTWSRTSRSCACTWASSAGRCSVAAGARRWPWPMRRSIRSASRETGAARHLPAAPLGAGVVLPEQRRRGGAVPGLLGRFVAPIPEDERYDMIARLLPAPDQHVTRVNAMPLRAPGRCGKASTSYLRSSAAVRREVQGARSTRPRSRASSATTSSTAASSTATTSCCATCRRSATFPA